MSLKSRYVAGSLVITVKVIVALQSVSVKGVMSYMDFWFLILYKNIAALVPLFRLKFTIVFRFLVYVHALDM